MRFTEVKSKVLQALAEGTYQHEIRTDIDEKNKLQTGEVTPEFVSTIISRSRGNQYECSPHHQVSNMDVHIIKKVIQDKEWYVKFYFADPDTIFISVHLSKG